MTVSQSGALARCLNIADLRQVARRRLPVPVFEYLDGGADDRWSLINNIGAFDAFELVPRCLRNVSRINTATKVLGQQLDWPVMLSPIGFGGLFHHHAELAAARAANNAGTLYTLSSFGSATIEDVAGATGGPKMFQLYMAEERQRSYQLLERAKACGYSALCLTVDTPVGGNREGEVRVGMPPAARMTLRSMASVLCHPKWLYHYLTSPLYPAANYFDRRPTRKEIALVAPTPSVCWDDVARLRDGWDGPLVIKGLLSSEDAKRAVSAGVNALIISNHGGRQLDTAPAPVTLISEFVAAVGNRAEIIVDSGFRRGTHIIKALALGASACMIGRPYVYGLAAGGQSGVERALQLLRDELVRDMRLLGTPSIEDINTSVLHNHGRIG